MKNAAKRVFSCKNRCRYSRKRATFCRNLPKTGNYPTGPTSARPHGAPSALDDPDLVLLFSPRLLSRYRKTERLRSYASHMRFPRLNVLLFIVVRLSDLSINQTAFYVFRSSRFVVISSFLGNACDEQNVDAFTAKQLTAIPINPILVLL